ncbi:MAG: SDR family oxidoreductase [Cellvibrio sp.]|uniref:SDR family NAD(P)-dependent oxidoreductase n=1 Tax=Cellvibrio sp. TaxID=1965322 RepID=UPI0031A1E092
MKIALVTGASRGIGRSAALQLAARDVAVVVTYVRGKDQADSLVAQIEATGGSAAALQLDVSKVKSFDLFAQNFKSILQRKWQRETFDYLVNNAGIGGFSLIADVTETYFDQMVNVHFKGPFFLTQILLPLLADNSKIINTTSATTRVAYAGTSPYAACKGAMDIITRCLAKEFGARGIQVNSISPGAIRTELADSALDKNPEFAQAIANETAFGRVGEADDVGKVIASLLSDDNNWINAQRIEVAGGFYI